MPNEPTESMRRLTSNAEKEIDALMTALMDEKISVDEFQDSMQKLLVNNHLASWMLGQASDKIGIDDIAGVFASVQSELIYLKNFVLIMKTAAEFSPGWFARARMYAAAFTRTFWGGKTKGLPLPAMPAQGTNCYSNCRCSWRIVTVDKDNGDYDCYWELDPFVEAGKHCQTCLERSEQWNPILIRDGILQV